MTVAHESVKWRLCRFRLVTSDYLAAFGRRPDSIVYAAAPRRCPESNTMMSSAPSVFTLGHSIDPDDAFMFYAMAENKIDLRGYRFEHKIEAIQTLNACAAWRAAYFRDL